jgi:hypothetical protein
MAENTNRSLFGFHGLFGFIISVGGLLAILTILMLMAIATQRNSQVRPYDPSVVRDINHLKANSPENMKYNIKKNIVKETK